MLPMVPLLALVALGMHARWKRGGLREARKPLLVTLTVALVIALLLVFAVYGVRLVMTPIAATLGLWIILSSLVDPIDRLRRGLSLPPSLIGMTVAHIGLGVFVLGITFVQSNSIELDVALKPGQAAQVGHYSFKYEGVQSVVGPNYDATRGTVSVTRGGRLVTVLHPEKKHNFVQGTEITTAAIAAALPRDLLAALGDDVGGGAWSLRFQYRPLIRLVWLGGVIMALGGTIAVVGRRRRLRDELAVQESAAAQARAEVA
jgi:cytochrome c-type biogenesis protein CcmF